MSSGWPCAQTRRADGARRDLSPAARGQLRGSGAAAAAQQQQHGVGPAAATRLRLRGTAARREQWRAMEDFHLAGKARSIGVSHYCPRHLADLLDDPKLRVRPAANQVEYHVGMGSAGVNATDGIAYMRQRGVAFLAFFRLA